MVLDTLDALMWKTEPHLFLGTKLNSGGIVVCKTQFPRANGENFNTDIGGDFLNGDFNDSQRAARSDG